MGKDILQSNMINNISDLANLMPKLSVQGVIEIIIFTYAIYEILLWIRQTRAYILLRGIIILVIFAFLAWIFKFTVILFIIEKSTWLIIVAIVIIFQNDIRTALEHLGRSKWLYKIIPDANRYSKKTDDKTVKEIVKATFAMAKVKTGALMVIEQNENLESIEKTGITINGKVSSGLLINIFEKNTPLHDGAVLIVGDIIKAATCYLPLSEKKSISKSLGTRHRAALGISEVSDCQVIVVSEETGNVSLVMDGELTRINDEKELTNALLNGYYYQQNEKITMTSRIKGFFKYEERKK